MAVALPTARPLYRATGGFCNRRPPACPSTRALGRGWRRRSVARKHTHTHARARIRTTHERVLGARARTQVGKRMMMAGRAAAFNRSAPSPFRDPHQSTPPPVPLLFLPPLFPHRGGGRRRRRRRRLGLSPDRLDDTPTPSPARPPVSRPVDGRYGPPSPERDRVIASPPPRTFCRAPVTVVYNNNNSV